MNILLAEDNDADVFLVHEALRAHEVQYQLYVVTNGTEVTDYLHRLGKSPDAPCPDIFLLDLNLPQSNGHDVLNSFRSHPECAHVPVIIVTSSDAPGDRKRAELLGANFYFRKPSELSEFLLLGEVVSRLVNGG